MKMKKVCLSNYDPDLGGDMGPWLGTPIWDPYLEPRFGTWFGTRFGTPPFGTAILDPDLGPRFGTPPFWTLIWDLDLGHPHLGPLFWTLFNVYFVFFIFQVKKKLKKLKKKKFWTRFGPDVDKGRNFSTIAMPCKCHPWFQPKTGTKMWLFAPGQTWNVWYGSENCTYQWNPWFVDTSKTLKTISLLKMKQKV
jgi:hypothetical protein